MPSTGPTPAVRALCLRSPLPRRGGPPVLRAFNPAGLVGFGLFLFSPVSFAAVQVALRSPGDAAGADAAEGPPLPLEHAAPEAVRQREAFRALADRARAAEPACRERDYRGDITLVRGKALV